MQWLTVCAALVGVMAAPSMAQWRAPAFCKGDDCPRYQKLQSMDGNSEVRRYEESTWVVTSVEQYGSSGSSNMFNRLFQYISGANARGQKIPMTRPVLTKYEDLGRMRYRITMMFYLEDSNAPAPTDPSVRLLVSPESTMCVRSFRNGVWWWPKWYTADWEYDRVRAVLERQVDASDRTAMDRVWYNAGYEGPMTWWNRYNEVWLQC